MTTFRFRVALFSPLAGALLAGGGVLADTFIGGHRLFFDRVDDRGVTDNQILKYDAATNKWLPDSDDVGEDTALPSNDTASATLRGNNAGDGWEQNTSLKSTSGGLVTLTGSGAGLILEKGGSETATLAGDDLVIRDVDGSGADVGISILTDSGSDAYAGLYFGSGTTENNSWIRAKDTYMDLRVDETTWLGATATQATFKIDTRIEDDKYLLLGTGNDAGKDQFKIKFDEAADDRVEVFDENGNILLYLDDTGDVGVLYSSGTIEAADDLTVGGDLLLGDDDILILGADSDFQLTYDETTDNKLELSDGTNVFLSVADGGTTGTFDITGTLTVSGLLTATGGMAIPGSSNIAFEDTGSFSITDGTNAMLTIEDDGSIGRLVLTGTDIELTTAGVIFEDGDENSLLTLDDGGSTGDVGITGDLTVGGQVISPIGTFGASDSTPSVAGGNIFKADATGAVTLSNLDDATEGQVITLVGMHSTNTLTVTDGATFYLGATRVLGSQDTLTLLCIDTDPANLFVELSYANN